jgi:NitT/TauT family transport system substrate-binding protein
MIRTSRLLVAASVLAAVSFSAFPAAAQSLTKWRHGTVEPKGDAGFIFMSKENGFAKKRGLDVEILPFKGDALALKALIAGELDTYLGTPGGPMVAASKGADVKIVGCNWPGLTYALYTKPNIGSVAELKGKTVSVSNPGALPDLFTRAVLRESGLTPSDVKFVIAGSDTDRVRAVIAGVVDAAPSSSEFATKAPSLGLKMLVHARDSVPNFVRTCVIARGDKLKNPDTLTRFLAAEMEGLKYAYAHRTETIDLSRKITNAKPDDPNAADIYDEAVKFKTVDPTLGVDRAKIVWMRDLLAQTGNIDAKFDPNAMIDTTARDAALKLAGSGS